MPRLLSVDLLEEFEQRLRSQNVPAIAGAQPGLDGDAMASIVSPLGLTLPVEARIWWGWHDGIQGELPDRDSELGPHRYWLSLEQAAAECQRMRDMADYVIARVPSDRPAVEAIWSRNWLPLIRSEGMYVIDTSVPDGDPCPVRVYWSYEPQAPPDLPSLGDLVSTWIEAIDREAWCYDAQLRRWKGNDAVLRAWAPARRGIV